MKHKTLDGTDVIYSPMLEDNQVIKIGDRIYTGYSAHFKIIAMYSKLDYAVDWGIDLAKENLKNFIKRI